MFPFNLSCNYISITDLSANNYQVIEEEMFISPICIDSRVKIGIYSTLIGIFFITGFTSLSLLWWSWNSKEPFSRIQIMKILTSIFPFARVLSLFLNITFHGIFRYFMYLFPVSISLVVVSLIYSQWFELTMGLSIFSQSQGLAHAIFKKIKIILITLNVLFNLGAIPLIMSAGYLEAAEIDMDLHNIIVGMSFVCQGLVAGTCGVVTTWGGAKLVSVLDADKIRSPQVLEIIKRIKKFYQFAGMVGVNVGLGCIGAAIWMGVTLHTQRGMSGFIYLLTFFICSEFSMCGLYWFLLLRPKDFGLAHDHTIKTDTGRHTDSKTDTSNKTPNLGKDVDTIVLELRGETP